jgi:hypothetical protein
MGLIDIHAQEMAVAVPFRVGGPTVKTKALFGLGGIYQMHGLIIQIWFNEVARDWSIEINNLRHEHVTNKIMEDLVECALIVAERSLTECPCHPN